MLSLFLIVLGLACFLALFLIRRNKAPKTPIDTTRRFRIVAFDKNSHLPSGYYTIEVNNGYGWRRVHRFLSGSQNIWNPILERYEAAKRIASEWKNVEGSYEAWLNKQYDLEKSYKEKLYNMYPVNCEEV